MESFNTQENISVEDYSEEPYFSLLKQLPAQLALFHIKHIESEVMTDQEASDYLSTIVEERQEVMQVSEISDTTLFQELLGREAEMFNQLENWTRVNPDNYLGTGTTATVKSYTIKTANETYELAIKYVITPNKKTLTAQAEHDVISEVERLKIIELAESKHEARTRFIRVPHPYLHHKNKEVQLFGMEKVDGINLQQARDGFISPDFLTNLKKSQLATMSAKEIEGYVERFFDTMHEYCLHGDIKPRNIMVNSDGVFYIIDFGQSRLAHTVPEEAQEQFDNLKADEIKMTTTFIKQLVNIVQAQIKEEAA